MGRATRVLAEGLYFGEGPRWRDGRLWFSDFWAHAIKSVSLAGDVRVEVEVDGDRPSGLGWLPGGDLIFVSMERRKLMRRGADGQVRKHADLSGIATWHCNDLVVDAEGRAYVGNFGFDLDHFMAERTAGRGADLATSTADMALVTADGRVSRAAADLRFPNGTVITPDGKTLIVGESMGGALAAFDIGADGALSNRREWASIRPRVPDGICLDAEGAIWVANAGGPECVRVAEGGEVLEVIDTGQPCYACMLGGDDGRTLFMLTAPSSIPEECSAAPKGKILVAQVDVAHAGRP
ncbi:SMP-30/gluconolactonase/LRE family protein [Caulobacter sp. KR2-114]|uniref:SMP-30/gluconolactonase/LRE family protein n=1 Tax=Caulobacter sp. KR2-114 TaxID=3400912 RepID=UPI003C063F88